MVNPIQSLNTSSIGAVPPSLKPIESTSAEQPFKNLLLESLQQVNSMQTDADHAVEQLVTGGEANPSEVFTAIQKADMSFRMLLQVRNKMMQAYQEIKDIRI